MSRTTIFDVVDRLDPNPLTIAEGRFWDPRDHDIDERALYVPVAGKAIASRTAGFAWALGNRERFPGGEWSYDVDPRSEEFKAVDVADVPADIETPMAGDWQAMSNGQVEAVVFQLRVSLTDTVPPRLVKPRGPSLEIVVRFLAVDNDLRG